MTIGAISAMPNAEKSEIGEKVLNERSEFRNLTPQQTTLFYLATCDHKILTTQTTLLAYRCDRRRHVFAIYNAKTVESG